MPPAGTEHTRPPRRYHRPGLAAGPRPLRPLFRTHNQHIALGAVNDCMGRGAEIIRETTTAVRADDNQVNTLFSCEPNDLMTC